MLLSRRVFSLRLPAVKLNHWWARVYMTPWRPERHHRIKFLTISKCKSYPKG
jgi:hypothetical protein